MWLVILVEEPNQVQLLLFSYFQAFTVVTVFNSMTFALKVTPFSVKSLSEASVAVDRFKVRGSLPLLHVRSHSWQNCFLYSSGPHKASCTWLLFMFSPLSVGKKMGSGGD